MAEERKEEVTLGEDSDQESEIVSGSESDSDGDTRGFMRAHRRLQGLPSDSESDGDEEVRQYRSYELEQQGYYGTNEELMPQFFIQLQNHYNNVPGFPADFINNYIEWTLAMHRHFSEIVSRITTRSLGAWHYELARQKIMDMNKNRDLVQSLFNDLQQAPNKANLVYINISRALSDSINSLNQQILNCHLVLGAQRAEDRQAEENLRRLDLQKREEARYEEERRRRILRGEQVVSDRERRQIKFQDDMDRGEAMIAELRRARRDLK